MRANVLRLLVAAALAAAGSAQATTYSNSDGASIIYFGAPDTTSYGETFNLASGQVLNDWTFYADYGGSGNMKLVVANWDGVRAVGPALYSSSVVSYGGGSSALSFSGIDTDLAAGSYIAYLTVAGVANPVHNVAIGGSSGDGGLGGSFRFLNSGGADPLSAGGAWSNWSVANMQYTANFSVAAPVPEPETWTLWGLGALALTFAVRRRAS